MRLAGTTVLLTGGREDLARALVREGARLIVYSGTDSRESAAGGAAFEKVADWEVFSPEPSWAADLERVAEHVWNRSGGMQGAVFAPRFDPDDRRSPFTEQSPDVWQRNIAANLELPFFLIRALATRMAAAGGGSVAVVATDPDESRSPVSTVVSAGLVTLTQGLAKVLPDGVSIVAVVGGSPTSQAAHTVSLLSGAVTASGTLITLEA